MNKYIFGAVRLINGMAKISILKVFNGKRVCIKGGCLLSPYTEITIEREAKLKVGKNWKMRSSSKVRVRKGANASFGDNFNMGNGSFIVCRDSITIGDNVSFGPGVLVYDHDHDYHNWPSTEYITGSIFIGNNVWIGANSVILRGTEIGEGSVVAAGTIVRGTYPSNSLIYQERNTLVKYIKRNNFENDNVFLK